jgi:predicted HAD superfamily phosphohydrolase YqeG
MTGLTHILAGFTLGFRYRSELARLLASTNHENILQAKELSSPNASIGDPALKSGFPITPLGMTNNLFIETWSATSIVNIDPSALQAKGILALALDFDGVLSHHGSPAPLPEAISWIKSCESVFGGNRIFILSNKPTYERVQWFAANFPAIRFISGVPKKPYPDGLKKTGELAECPLSSILMIDDRLLTGCLAALVAGARPCYIRRPYFSFRHLTLPELFFRFVRIGERMFVRLTSSI